MAALSQVGGGLGSSLLGSGLGFLFVQRYGRKNSYRGPAAFRVIATISMVLCGGQNLMLAQCGLVVLLSSVMEFTLELYSVELYAVRSRGTAAGLLLGVKTFGVASMFLANPLLLHHVSPDLKFSVITVLGSLMFGAALGLRKDTRVMSLNIDQATLDIGL